MPVPEKPTRSRPGRVSLHLLSEEQLRRACLTNRSDCSRFRHSARLCKANQPRCRGSGNARPGEFRIPPDAQVNKFSDLWHIPAMMEKNLSESVAVDLATR